MDATATLLYAGLLLAALIYLAAVLPRGGNNLPPGPTGLPVVGSLLSLDPQLHAYFARLASRYGPIFSIRLGSKFGVVVTSPALAREVLRDQDLLFSGRDVPDAARSISYGGGQNIVWNPVGPTWRLLRRVCVREMLSPAGLDNVRHLHAQAAAAAGGADVPHHHERHHRHAVGREHRRRRRARRGGEGVPPPRRRDHRDARRAQRLRLLPGARALRPAGHPEEVRRAQGAIQPDVRQDHRAEGEGRAGRRRAPRAGLPRLHAQAREGRRRREGRLHHDQREGAAHGHGGRGHGDDFKHRGVGHGGADAQAAAAGQGAGGARRRGGSGRRRGGVPPPAAPLPARRGQGDAPAPPGAAADGAALPRRRRHRRRLPRPRRQPRVRQRLGHHEGPRGVGGPGGVRPGALPARRRRRRGWAEAGLQRQRDGVPAVRVRAQDLRGDRHGRPDDGLLAGDAAAGLRLGAARRRAAGPGGEVRDRDEEGDAAGGRADAEAVQA